MAFKWLKTVFSKKKPDEYPDVLSDGKDESQAEFSSFSMEGLWDSFEKRTYHYERFRKAFRDDSPRLLHWIGSVDYSGYTREKSLRYLIENYQEGDENRILLRLADWVPEIRQVARAWVLEHFQGLPVESIKQNARLILFLSRKRVLADDPAMKHIHEVLLSSSASMGKKAFYAFNAGFRRYLYSLSLNGDQGLRAWIMDDKDPFNRLLLLNHPACEHLTPEEMQRLNQDASALVRRKYLDLRLSRGQGIGREELKELAFHSHRGLRQYGRFYLNKFYDVDACTLYREAQGDAFYYIADCPRKEDTGHFIEGVSSDNKKVRLICLRALSVVDPDSLRGLDLEMLILQSRKTREIIFRHLPRLLTLEELENLGSVIKKSSANGTLSYLKMLERKSYWRFVDAALRELLARPSDDLVASIRHDILKKTAVYESLAPDLRKEIDRKVMGLKSEKDPRIEPLISYLEFMVKGASL